MEKRFWRIVTLFLLVTALLGTWGFDRIHVPTKYFCNPPFVRLEGDFCGEPFSGIWLISYLTQGWIETGFDVISNPGAFAARGREFSIMLLAYSFMLPLLSTPLVIWKENSRGARTFHLLTLGFSALLGVFVVADRFQNPKPFLWAPWLYVVTVFVALMWEVILWKRETSKTATFETGGAVLTDKEGN